MIFSHLFANPVISREPTILLVATNNPGKLAELEALLHDLPIRLCSLGDLESFSEVEETGNTFLENAQLKASGYATQSGLAAIADDSGLEVEALDGRPGVLSARYGGVDTGFDEKMRMLLDELDTIGDSQRNARFVSAMAISDPTGKILHTTDGVCTGKIALQPRGDLGFGFDPLFIPDGFDKTFGELPAEIKQKISHRAGAFNRIIPFLRDFIAV
ncbi:MAG: RdgB/HAM1 family non-canonical purine NTP pyrophosphatase [Pyrinomonadaceae bacterium]